MTDKEIELPPILQTPGLRMLGMGTTDRGLYFKLGSKHPKRMIAIVVHGAQVFYEYTMLDPETRTMQTYRGPYGDPEKDEPTGLDGLEHLPTDG